LSASTHQFMIDTLLVYYEHTTDVHAALAREKELKKWRREKKDNLVASINPNGRI
jgi:putative endonuclease